MIPIKQTNSKRLVTIGLLIAIEIVLSRIFTIPTPYLKISLSFVPIAIIGYYYGPLYAGLAGVLADLIGTLLIPFGPYFIGFTLSAFLIGLLYGLLFYKKKLTLPRVILAATIVCLVLQFALGSVWLYIIMGNGVFGMLPTRLIKSLIMIPVQVLIISLLFPRIKLLKEN